MEMQVVCQGKNEAPKVKVIHPIIDFTDNMSMTVAVIEAGMKSGEPSVIIISKNKEGTVLLQTSLDKFLMAGITMKALAEERFGWVQKEGTFTILPPDKETRKKILEGIKKELEEWDNWD